MDPWRLVRNPYTRRAYEALRRAGVTATRMYEYVARGAPAPVDPPAGVDVTVHPPGERAALDHPHAAERRDDEFAVVARADGPVGHLFVGVDATHRVDALERRLSVEGAYLRRVWVAPARRNEGVASALVARARGAVDAGRATALVAADNRPSRRLFAARGFRPRRVHTYARVGPVAVRRTA